MLPCQRMSVVFLVLLGIALTSLTAGCGASQGVVSRQPGTATPNRGALATDTPTLEPTLPPKTQTCPSSLSTEPGSVRIGDVVLSTAFVNPDGIFYQLPDNTLLKPLQVPVSGSIGPQPDPSWPKSILTATTVYAYICNASTTQAHTITAMHIKLAAFTPYTAQLSAWDFCSGTFSNGTGVIPTNCDRPGFTTDVALQATLAATSVGTVVDAMGSYPLTLPANTLLTIGVNFVVPPIPGTFSFAVDATSDVGALPYSGTTALLNAPIAHIWTGPACLTPAMRAQIPAATNPPTLYICPKS